MTPASSQPVPDSQPVSDSPEPVVQATRVLSGTRVIIGLFLFAGLVTAGLWFFWNSHIGSFVPLIQALSKEFKDSKPRIEAGKPKKKGNDNAVPMTFRVTMEIDYNPKSKPHRVKELEERVRKFIVHFSKENSGSLAYRLEDYEKLELLFFWPNHEKNIVIEQFDSEMKKVLAEDK